MSTRRFGGLNDVPECPGWHFGLFIRHDDGTRDFTVFGPNREQIDLERVQWDERVSRAQAAIRNAERRSP